MSATVYHWQVLFCNLCETNLSYIKNILNFALQKVFVLENSGEFSNIFQMFSKTVSGHVVKKLWRVQNPSLWQVYQWYVGYCYKIAIFCHETSFLSYCCDNVPSFIIMDIAEKGKQQQSLCCTQYYQAGSLAYLMTKYVCPNVHIFKLITFT